MPFRPPSFTAVIAFEAAARYESFARAAVELNLTQSAISHAIRTLEARLGQSLFLRRGRRVMLTPRGAKLARRVRAGLSLMANAFSDEADPVDPHRVVIGAPPDFTAQVLLPHLAAGDLLDSCEVRTTLSVSALNDGSADLIVAPGAGSWPDLASRRLGIDSVFPVASPQLARTRGFPDLGCLPLVENLAHPWRLWLAQVQNAHEPAVLGLVVDDWRLAIDAAKAGAGVCLARSSLAREDLAAGRLIRVGDAELTIGDGYHLLWDPRAKRRGAAVAIIERLTGEPLASGEGGALSGPRLAVGVQRRAPQGPAPELLERSA